jgi:hypothetical protein
MGIEMGFSLNSGERVADVRLVSIQAKAGLGVVELLFSVEWMFSAASAGKGGRIHSTSGVVYARVANAAEPRFIGQTWPESCWFGRRLDQPHPSPLQYRTVIGMEQLLAIERARQGQGLEWIIELTGTVEGVVEGQLWDFRGHDTVRKQITAQEWSATLRPVGLKETIFIEMELPLEDPDIAAPVRKSMSQFFEGDYQAAIGNCRIAIESLFRRYKLQGLIDTVSNREREGKARREHRSLYERQVFFADAVRQIAHSAMHTTADGVVPTFSRNDAHGVLSGTISSVRSIIAQQVNREAVD